MENSVQISKITKKALIRSSVRIKKFKKLNFRVKDEHTLSLLQEDSKFKDLVKNTDTKDLEFSILPQDDGCFFCELNFQKGSFYKSQIQDLACEFKLEVTGPRTFLLNLGKQNWLGKKFASQAWAQLKPPKNKTETAQSFDTTSSNNEIKTKTIQSTITTPLTNKRHSLENLELDDDLEDVPIKKLKGLNSKLNVMMEDTVCIKDSFNQMLIDKRRSEKDVPMKRFHGLESKLNAVLDDTAFISENLNKLIMAKNEENSRKALKYEELIQVFHDISEARESQQRLLHLNEQSKILLEAKETFLAEKEQEIDQLKRKESFIEKKARDLDEREKLLEKRETIVQTDKIALDTKIKEFMEAARRAAVAEESSKKEIQKLEGESKQRLLKFEMNMKSRIRKEERDHLDKLRVFEAEMKSRLRKEREYMHKSILSDMTNKENRQTHELNNLSFTSYVR